MKTLTKKKTKVWLVGLQAVLLSVVLAVSGIGIYLKLNQKKKIVEDVRNPLSFSIDEWDGKTVNALEFNEDYAGRGERTKTIDSAASFVYFANEVNSGETFEGYTIYLNKNIDLKGFSINSIGTEENPFKGKFDGGYYTILNANINGNGLFGVADGAEICNVGLYNANIDTNGIAGGLIAKAINTNISNCFVRAGKISSDAVSGGLVGEYVSNNGVHTISNSFSHVGGDVATLIALMDCDNSASNTVDILNCYHAEGPNTAIFKYAGEHFVNEETFVSMNKDTNLQNEEGWLYSKTYNPGFDWCDYECMEGTYELDFKYPVQSGFVKVYKAGSYYESVVTVGDEVVDAPDLAYAFAEVNENPEAEAEVVLIVEKIFMEARAEVHNATITVSALKDTTIVRGESNEDSMFVASEEGKIVLGGNEKARTNETTLTLDGNREYVEKEDLNSGALIVSFGGNVEIGDNVVLQNNINTTVGYGGAVLVYDAPERPAIDATIENCYAEYAGGGVCIVGKAPTVLGSISNCSTKGNGGAAAIVNSLDELGVDPAEPVRAMAKLYGGKGLNIDSMAVVPPIEPPEFPGEDDSSSAPSYAVSSITLSSANYNGNSAGENGGAIYVTSSITFGIREATRSTFTGCHATLKGGAIYYGGSNALNIKYATFKGNYINSTTASATLEGGAIYVEKSVTVTINYSTFEDNYIQTTQSTANLSGGAIYNYGNMMRLGDSVTFERNRVYSTSSATHAKGYGSAIYHRGNMYIGSNIQFKGNGTILDGTITRKSRYGHAMYVVAGGDVTFVTKDDLDSGYSSYNLNTTEWNANSLYVGSLFDASYDENENLYLNYGCIKATGDVYIKGSFRSTVSAYDGIEAYMVDISGSATITSSEGYAIYATTSVSIEADSEDDSIDFSYNAKRAIQTGGTVTINSSGTMSTNGGAIYAGGAVNVSGISFTYNTVYDYGGAIRAGGDVEVSDCEFVENWLSGGFGGAIYTSGTVTVSDCEFNGNYSYEQYSTSDEVTFTYDIGGGAIYAGTVTLNSNVSFEGNWIYSKFSNNQTYGGAISCNSITFAGTNITFNNNGYYSEDETRKTRTGGAISVNGTSAVTFPWGVQVSFTGNKAVGNGGAIYTTKPVQLHGTQNFTDNSAQNGGAIYTTSSVELIVDFDGNFEGNKATSGNGGAIYNTGSIYIYGAPEFVDNTASSYGGAIYNSAGSAGGVYVTGSITCTGNSALQGGAIYSIDTTLSIIGNVGTSTFEKNMANHQGGAIYYHSSNTSTSEGEYLTQFIVSNATFTHNAAVCGEEDDYPAGGAIYAYGQHVELQDGLMFESNHATHTSENHDGVAYGGVMFAEAPTADGVFLVSGEVDIGGNGCCGGEYDPCNDGEDYSHYYSACHGMLTVKTMKFIVEDDANLEFYGNWAICGNGILNYDADHKLILKNIKFENDSGAENDGGEVWSSGPIAITDSVEINLDYAIAQRGGLIYSCSDVEIWGDVNLYGDVSLQGGVIYAEGDVKIVESASPTLSGNAGVHTSDYESAKGGVIYAEGEVNLTYTPTENLDGTPYVASNQPQTTHFASFWACYGGAIYASAVYGKNATFGNGEYGSGADLGGAIYATGDVDIDGAQFIKMSCYMQGGAISADGSVYIKNCTFTSCGPYDNSWYNPILGGAIYFEGETGEIESSTFSLNNAMYGGAIYAAECIKLEIKDDCSFLDNVDHYSDGFDDFYDGRGGAIYFNAKAVDGAELLISGSDVTFNGNGLLEASDSMENGTMASGNGGAIYATKSSGATNTHVTISGSATFTNNSALYGGAYNGDVPLTITGEAYFNNNYGQETSGAIEGGVIINGASNVEFNGNSSYYYPAGAIYGGVIITDSNVTFNGNYACLEGLAGSEYESEALPCGGGAVQGSVEILNSTVEFTGNYTDYGSGGAVSGSVYIESSTVDFICNYSWYNGGAVSGSVTISENSTVNFSENYCAIDGYYGPDLSFDEEMEYVSYNYGGGAVYGSVSVADSSLTVDSNSISYGCGGGISGNVEVSNSELIVSSNTTYFYGAGIYGDLQATNSSTIDFTSNSSGACGGGIYCNSFDVAEDCFVTFSGNNAEEGGGIYITDDIEINCAFDIIGNSCALFGGAIWSCGNITVNTSPFSNIEGNTCSGGGGAVFYACGDVTINADICFIDNDGGCAIYAENNVTIAEGVYCYFNGNDGYAACIFGNSYVYIHGKVDIENSNTYDGAICACVNVICSSTSEVNITGCTGDSKGGGILAYTVTIEGKFTAEGNSAEGFGGAIFAGSDVNINEGAEVEFTNNTAGYDGGAIWGGGVYINEGAKATFTNNKALDEELVGYGGAIYGGSIEIYAAAEFTGNSAGNFGGAIYSGCGTWIDAPATFIGNTAEYGGAIYNSYAPLSISDQIVIANNTAEYGQIYSDWGVKISKDIDISGDDGETVLFHLEPWREFNPKYDDWEEVFFHIRVNGQLTGEYSVYMNNATFYTGGDILTELNSILFTNESDYNLSADLFNLVNMPANCGVNYDDIQEYTGLIVKSFMKPTIDQTTYYFKNDSYTLSPSNFLGDYMTISGNSEIDGGRYQIEINFKTVNDKCIYKWRGEENVPCEDMQPLTFDWEIIYPQLDLCNENEESFQTVFPRLGSIAQYAYPHGEDTAALDMPTKSGYGFLGYFTEGGTKVIDSDLELVPGVAGYTDANGNWALGNEGGLLVQRWVKKSVQVNISLRSTWVTGFLDTCSPSGEYSVGDIVTLAVELKQPNFKFYQWYKNGAEYASTTTATYTITENDVNAGTPINFVATASSDFVHKAVTNFIELNTTGGMVSDSVQVSTPGQPLWSDQGYASGEIANESPKTVSMYAKPLDGYYFYGWYLRVNPTPENYETAVVARASDCTYVQDATLGNYYSYKHDLTSINPADGQVGGGNFYALFLPNKTTVTLNPQGGTVTPNTVDVEFGSTYGTLPTPNRNGYSFLGWYASNLASVGDQTISINNSYYNNTALNVALKPSTEYTVSFDYNVVSNASGEPLYAGIGYGGFAYQRDILYGEIYPSYTQGSSGKFVKQFTTPATFDITNNLWMRFARVNSPATYTVEISNIVVEIGDGTTRTYITPSTKVINVSDHTLTADWNPITYSISYDLAGGTLETANPASYNVETASFTLNNPTKLGYTFKGWTGSNGTTPQTTVTIAKGSTGNKTYTANWEALTSYLNKGWQTEMENNVSGYANSKVKTIQFVAQGESLPNEFNANNYVAVGATSASVTTVNNSVLAYYRVDGSDYHIAFMSPSNGTIYAPQDCSYLFSNSTASKRFTNLTSITFDNFETSNVTHTNFMFYYCSKLTSLSVNNWDTDRFGIMYYMFSGCSSLQSLDVSQWDVSSATNLEGLFSSSSALTELDLSNWNTSNVTNMSHMFSNCSALSSIKLKKDNGTSTWNTSKVTNMNAMFHGASQLKTLDVSNWDTAKVTDMTNLFRNCSSLTELDVSNWNTGLVTTMHSVFNECSALTELDLSNCNTSKVQDMSYMFYNCKALTSVKFIKEDGTSTWNTSNVTDMNCMFYECRSLVELNLSKWNTSKVANMNHLFYHCYAMKDLNISGFDISNVSNMTNMLYFGSSSGLLDKLYLPKTFGTKTLSIWTKSTMIVQGTQTKLVTSSTTSTVSTTYTQPLVRANTVTANANSGTISSSTGWTGTGSTATRYVAYDEGISVLPTATRTGYELLGWFDAATGGNPVSATTTFTANKTIYAQWEKLTSYLNNTWQTLLYNSAGIAFSQIKTIQFIKQGENLPSVFNANNYVAVGAKSATDMTANTSVLAYYRADGSYYHLAFMSANKETIYAPQNSSCLFGMIQPRVDYINSIVFDNFDTSNVTDMSYMFASCDVLTSLDLSTFNTSNVSNMSFMFNNSGSLETITGIEKFDTKNVTNMNSMFCGCRGLTELDLSNFITNKVTDMNSMLAYCTSLIELNLSSFDISLADVYGMLEFEIAHSEMQKLHLPGTFGNKAIDIPLSLRFIVKGTQTVVSGGSSVNNSYATKILVAYNTVTANANSGTIASSTGWAGTGTTATRYVAYDEGISVFPTATRDGYELLGWFDAATGGNPVSTTTTLTANKTIYAQWKQSTVTVTIASNNNAYGTVNPTSVANVPIGSAITVSGNTITVNGTTVTATPASDTAQYDYEFSAWSVSNGATVTGAMEITATFTQTTKKYTVTWVNHDNSQLEQDTNVPYGTPPTYNGSTPVKEKAGYTCTFAGWTPAISNVTGNITYKATFTEEIITYTIGYNLDGGTVATANPESYTVETATITLNNPTKTGYTFKGWTGSNGNTPQTTVTIAKGSTGNKSYTANWEANGYTVIYNGNGSTGGSTANSTHTYDVEKALTANGFERKYVVTFNHNYTGSTNSSATATYTFKHWTTAANGTGSVYTNQQVVKNLATSGTYNLFAQWNSASVTLPTPTRTGYTFIGWYADNNAETKVGDAGASYTPTANITLFAAWQVTIRVNATNADGSDYYVEVYDSNNKKTEYRDDFVLIDGRTYTINACSALKNDLDNNDYQVLRVRLNDSIVATATPINTPSGTVYSYKILDGAISSGMAIDFEYLSAYKLTVNLEANRINGVTVEIAKDANNNPLIFSYSSKKDYIIVDGTTVKFTVNSTPAGSDIYTFTGITYVTGGNSHTVGVEGGSGIQYLDFDHNDNYQNDSDVGTYYYSVTNGVEISQLTINAELSKVVTIASSNIVVGTTLTLQSEHGLNKVLENSTSSIVLYQGQWKVLNIDVTLDTLQAIFKGYDITHDGEHYVVDIP